MKIVLELPYYSTTSGGIRESLKLAEKFDPQMIVRFQRLEIEYPQIPLKWTVGLPDNTFPECDVVITYSDNPYLNRLQNLPQVGKVVLNMLSWGMSIDNERRNVLNKHVTVVCSTKKIEQSIKAEGVDVTRIGFALDMEEMYDEHLKRENWIAIMANQMESKRTLLAISIAEQLIDEGIINKYILFGEESNKWYCNYPRANREQLRYIFNICKCFLMPSISEGLNLTPIEATMCACPSVICDGAIDEVFFHGKNCFVVPKDNQELLKRVTKESVLFFDQYTEIFRTEMVNIVNQFKWQSVIENLKSVL